MRIAIAGAGAVGMHLASVLVGDEHEVLVLDENEAVVVAAKAFSPPEARA